jgi:membrane-associated phospholipid phosphatase
MKHLSKLYLPFCLLIAVGSMLVVSSCHNVEPAVEYKSVKDFDHGVVYDWNELFLEVERYAAGYRPGPAPRALAHIGLANYEACLDGMPEFNSMATRYGISIPQADPGNSYHWPTVINYSYAYLMRRFFPLAAENLRAKINTLVALNDEKYKNDLTAEVFDRSRQHGEAVAAAVWEYSKTDKIGHDHYLDPFQGYDWQAKYKKDGDWKPTFPGPGKPMGGVWGGARTFAISEADKICRPPLPYNESTTSDLYSQALEVYAQNTPTLSYEDEWVGEFWSDDLLNLTFSPGPRWLAIGDQALKAEKSDLTTALFMGVKIGLALNDASIGCWNSKYHYNVERPQSYINRVIDPKWKPALYNPLTGDQGVTPSFPAYPSGHSTMGAAGAEVLGSIFGYAYDMTDRCHENRSEFEGKPRTFGSFLEMAQENAWSRVPLGVHFRMDCEEGVRYGTVIGRKVNALPWRR